MYRVELYDSELWGEVLLLLFTARTAKQSWLESAEFPLLSFTGVEFKTSVSTKTLYCLNV